MACNWCIMCIDKLSFYDKCFGSSINIYNLISCFTHYYFPANTKNSKAKKTATNSELNIGENATVIEDINSENGTGRVNLNGVDWMAVSDCIIPAGSTVVVTEIDGAKLKVILKHKEQHINL